MNIGTKNGETRSGPFSRYTWHCSSKVASPPVPLPMITPTRFKSTWSHDLSRQASFTACAAAAIANCANRS